MYQINKDTNVVNTNQHQFMERSSCQSKLTFSLLIGTTVLIELALYKGISSTRHFKLIKSTWHT